MLEFIFEYWGAFLIGFVVICVVLAALSDSECRDMEGYWP